MNTPRASLSNIIRSTPVRIALWLVLVFAAVNLVTLGGAYVTLKAQAEAEIRADLTAEIAGLDITATPNALRRLVEVRARATDPRDRVYLFLGDDGRRAGNADARLSDGNVILSASDGQALSHTGYVQEVRRLSSGILVIAQSLERVEDLRRTFLWLLALSLLPTVVLSLGLGTLIARRSARRVARIETTLSRIAGGDLTARYDPGASGEDDLTRIGRGVNRMAARQEEATEALRQVSADIAHDLRTPLQRIAVLLDELQAKTDEDDPRAPLADRARAEADRAVRVFQSLLQIAQIEGAGARADAAPVDLTEIAREMAELYEPVAEEAGVALSTELPSGPVPVTGDRALLGQALANLIENALRHGNATPIVVSVTNGADGPALSVTDSGPGIPEAERGLVTRRLYRLETSRTTPGNGLGLALVTAIAQAHRAVLDLSDNRPGLRASLQFPR
ncbi:putative sensor histidine kinase TcrY [Roseivivax sp. THAF40]|uniref:HAMP domain-containing sensor histidine kinase n=1 Tax=unclassified Roseivivax TaxID=2639302 RepID=UPI00126934A2|nr:MULTISPECIES: HAMP domain-containing sensor histidine kinase [unclassified Roseivivax]QFS84053.1 putative sensor histidine kinase TcrY [Roseivivax sp. THAF197b]QFT47880.1 putative sensor histidine kinase TcrY [Roseivivax sp. THAF40]